MESPYKVLEIVRFVQPFVLLDELVEALGRLGTSRDIFRIYLLQDSNQDVIA
jgi:hypothetical protein